MSGPVPRYGVRGERPYLLQPGAAFRPCSDTGTLFLLYARQRENIFQSQDPQKPDAPRIVSGRSVETPAFTLNGVPIPAADILFCGLTPTQVGLYQVDLAVPAKAPNGDLTLILNQPNGPSASVVIPVHN